LATSFNAASCDNSPYYANPPVEIAKIAWRLGANVDLSPWIFLDVTVKNTGGNRDIKGMLPVSHKEWHKG